MTILYEYVYGAGPLLWASIILWALAIASFICITILVFIDKKVEYVILYVFVALAIIAGYMCSTDTRCHMVKALIDDTIPYTEVCKNYEYVSKEGDIWTLRVLEGKEE